MSAGARVTTALKLAATIGFATINAIAVLARVGVPTNMQMALPVNIKPGTFALTGTASALLYP
jgi:hypothetical protein